MNIEKNFTREQTENQYQEIHPEFQRDWSGIHMDDKVRLPFWQTMLILPCFVGCCVIFFFGIIAFFVGGYRYVIPIFVIGCWAYALFCKPTPKEEGRLFEERRQLEEERQLFEERRQLEEERRLFEEERRRFEEGRSRQS